MAIESGPALSAIIPRPIQVVIDDVGWWSGRDGSKHGGTWGSSGEPGRIAEGKRH
jgi:hypothetical protein